MDLAANSAEKADVVVFSTHSIDLSERPETLQAVALNLPHEAGFAEAGPLQDLLISRSQLPSLSNDLSHLGAKASRQACQLNALMDELVLSVNHLARLSRRLHSMASADAEASCVQAMNALITRLNNNYYSKIENSSRKSSLRLCVENYIKRNLSSKDITPEIIYRQLEVPRSTLYKAFADIGGVAKYIQDVRLDVARSLLIHPEEHRSLSDIADSLGFKTSAQFSKAYRRRFGISPRDVRRISPDLQSK